MFNLYFKLEEVSKWYMTVIITAQYLYSQREKANCKTHRSALPRKQQRPEHAVA